MKSIFKYAGFFSILLFLGSCQKDNQANVPSGSSGTGGSLARFTVVSNYLYIVDGTELHSFSLDIPDNPVKVNTLEIGLNIETIFPYKDKLFIGSMDAMYIYSISNPAKPSLLGRADHLRACDPVVANDSIAYVTVRSGNTCGGEINSLFIYNINNVLSPRQQNVVPLSNPFGLGIRGSRLFICDGSSGLKIFDISDPVYPQQQQVVAGETYYDCIPYEDILICMVKGGVVIYNIAEDEIKMLSKITD